MKDTEILNGYISMKQISEEYNMKWWKVAYLLRNRKNNGVEEIIIKIGSKFYIKREDFDQWITKNNVLTGE